MHRLSVVALTSALSLAGCEALFVPKVPTAPMKMDWAAELIRIGRPIPAERLIQESMAIYQAENDLLGLGNTHQYYGVLLTSSGVTAMEWHYRPRGFEDRTVTFDNRRAKAAEHYARSLEYFELAEREALDSPSHERLPVIYFNTAVTYANQGEKAKVCEFLEKSSAADAERARDPTCTSLCSIRDRIGALASENGCSQSSTAQ